MRFNGFVVSTWSRPLLRADTTLDAPTLPHKQTTFHTALVRGLKEKKKQKPNKLYTDTYVYVVNESESRESNTFITNILNAFKNPRCLTPLPTIPLSWLPLRSGDVRAWFTAGG